MSAPDRVEALQAEARHSRERYQLYRARTYGPRATSPARLRELKRLSETAQDRAQAAARTVAGAEE